MEGREQTDFYSLFNRQLGKLVEVTERNAIASEAIVRLATEERDVGESMLAPPVCPHCGTFDPELRSEGGHGHMSEFVLVGQCLNCNRIVYAIPQGWLCYQTKEQAVTQLSEKGGQHDNDG